MVVIMDKRDGAFTSIRTPNITEYTSLREELIVRVEAINNQASAALTSILASWASAIALLVLSFGDNTQQFSHLVGFDIAQSITLIIPGLVLIPLAIKSGENLVQIVSLSCYIRVFFEHAKYSSDSLFFAWEGANNSISLVNVRRKRVSPADFYNSEYTILSIASSILYIAFTILEYYRITSVQAIPTGLIIFHVVILVIVVSFAIITANITSIKKTMREPAIKYTAGYVLFGQNRNLLPKDDDFARRILDEAHSLDDHLHQFIKNYTEKS